MANLIGGGASFFNSLSSSATASTNAKVDIETMFSKYLISYWLAMKPILFFLLKCVTHDRQNNESDQERGRPEFGGAILLQSQQWSRWSSDSHWPDHEQNAQQSRMGSHNCAICNRNIWFYLEEKKNEKTSLLDIF